MTDWWRKPFDPFKSRTSYTIVMYFESEFLMTDFIKGLAEVKQNDISLDFWKRCFRIGDSGVERFFSMIGFIGSGPAAL